MPQTDMMTPTSTAFLDEIRRRLAADKRPWLATADVAGIFGVDPNTILEWIDEGRINATNLNAGRMDAAGKPMRPFWRLMRVDVIDLAERIGRGV